MKNSAIGVFVAVITLAIVASIVRAQIMFPDSTVQTTAFKCVPAGTGTWSEPEAVGTALIDGVNEGLWLDSTIDCSGTLHWVRTHYVFTSETATSELLYSNSDSSGLVTLDYRIGSSFEGNTLITSPSISIDPDGNIFVMYLLKGDPDLVTPYKVENLTP